ncbi:hypothetical protein D046_1954A, partial [Vibrio parahaemolyticus V-223/04]
MPRILAFKNSWLYCRQNERIRISHFDNQIERY